MTIAMAGGGTGGHVMPLLAVAAELERRGRSVFFIGTRHGLESRLVPARGYRIEYIEIGGLKRTGWKQQARVAWQLPVSALSSMRLLKRAGAAAVFSLGGYVAGPPVVAALLLGLPVIAMEPNAEPGLTNRKLGHFFARTLIAFEETARYFPPGKAELTGVPVRDEFFDLPPKPPGEPFTILITGGSQGARTLNEAARASWPLFRESGLRVRLVLQAGRNNAAPLQDAFASSGLDGRIVDFIDDMPSVFAESDLIVCRSGAGAVSELAAAGKASILCPFPYAADDHQTKNALTLSRAGAAVLVANADMTGQRLFDEVRALSGDPSRLAAMGEAARKLSRRGAARRAAELLEEVAVAA